jgi:hypothetical protein
MNSRWRTLFGLAGVTLSLVGCGPRNITGQVFIVTRAAENIKLGLVQVQFIEEHEVDQFVTKMNLATQSERESRAERARKAEQEFTAEQTRWDEFVRTNAMFQAPFRRARDEAEHLKVEIARLEEESHAAYRIWYDALAHGLKEAMELQKEYNELSATLKSKQERAPQLEEQLLSISVPSEKEALSISNRLESLRAAHALRMNESRIFPTADFYFSKWPVTSAQEAITDADGKFNVKLPRSGRFAVFAKATREVGLKTECYVWFFWLPRKTDEGPLLLCNKNLAYATYAGNILAVAPIDSASE